MNRTALVGMIAACMGFLLFGFFMGGPGFLSGRFVLFDKVGPYVALVLFFGGLAVMVFELRKKR